MHSVEPVPNSAAPSSQGEATMAPASQLTPPYAFGASVIGPLHVQKGIPCQDACAYEVLVPSVVMAAVADGLGSAPKSEVGACTAVAAALEKVRERVKSQQSEQYPLSDIIREAFMFARHRLEDKATQEGWNLRDLACTLIVAVGSGNSIAVGHVGDGAVVAQVGDALSLVSSPGESEYANEVTPLTDEKWVESLRIASDVHGVQCLAIFTDGCQRAAFLKSSDAFVPFRGFFDPIFSYSRQLTSMGEAVEEIK